MKSTNKKNVTQKKQTQKKVNGKLKNSSNKRITIFYLIIIIYIVIIGYSYAYFSINTTNGYSRKNVYTTLPSNGSVALNNTNSSLKLNLSAVNMMQNNQDIVYYATETGTPNIGENIITIGIATVTGDGTYNCDYTLEITKEGTNDMYDAFQNWKVNGYTDGNVTVSSSLATEGQIILNINGTNYDFNRSSLFPITYEGTMNGITKNNPGNINASLYINNKSNINQNAIAGTDITIKVKATDFSCLIANS